MPGGGGSTNSTVTQSNLPAYAKPFYESLMGRAEKESKTDYTPYKGDRIADMSNATKLGLNAATKYGQSGLGLLQKGADAVSKVASDAANQNYGTGNFNTGYTGKELGNYSTGKFNTGYNGVDQNYKGTNFDAGYTGKELGPYAASKYQSQQLAFGQGGIDRIGTSAFDKSAADKYMSPYMDAVVNKAQADALQNAADAQATRNLQAARSGSFGGSRAAVQNQMANNALQSNLTDIMVKGQQSAFENAQSQFNTDQARMLDAARANQSAGLTMGQANQNAALEAARLREQSSQFGYGQSQDALQKAADLRLAAQQAQEQSSQFGYDQRQSALQKAADLRLAEQQAAEQSRQFGRTTNQDALQKAADLRLAEQQAREQSRQFGADLGLKGLDLSRQAGMDLNTLQSSMDNAQLSRIKALLGVGTTQEDYQQQQLDQNYNDFVNQRDSERMNLQFLSSILQGVPISVNQDVTSSQGGGNNLAGLLGGAGGLQALMALGKQ